MQIKHWDHIDAALLKIKNNQSEIDRQNLDFEKKTSSWSKKIENAKSKMLLKTEPLQKENEELDKQIKDFQEKNQVVTSMELKNGIFKRRSGKSRIEFLENETTDSILKNIKRFLSNFKDRYIRVKEEINKRAIIEDFDSNKINNLKLKKAGIEVVREDSFSYELK